MFEEETEVNDIEEKFRSKTISILKAMYDENLMLLRRVLTYQTKQGYVNKDNIYILNDDEIIDPFAFIECKCLRLFIYSLSYDYIEISKDVFKKVIKYWLNKLEDIDWFRKEVHSKIYIFNSKNLFKALCELGLATEVTFVTLENK